MKAGTEEMSRQKRYKVIRFREGCCVNCGKPRGESLYKRVCADCGDERKKLRRWKLGSKPWTAGSPGRPPLSVSHNETEETL